MGDGIDANLFSIYAVYELIRKDTQQYATHVSAKRSANMRKLQQQLPRRGDIGQESVTCARRLIVKICCCLFELLDGFGLQTYVHG
jgi:hypothetical protein